MGLQVIILDLTVSGGEGSLRILQSYFLVLQVLRALFDIRLEFERAFSFVA